MRAAFAIPGALDSPTGGYAYARRVMAEGEGLVHLPLPGAFPHPSAVEVDTALATLADIPADCPILLDGLAGGVLPGDALAALPAPVVMLCHHPLALETGLQAHQAADLRVREAKALAATRHVITTSHATANLLVGQYGVAHNRLTVAPPGTDSAPQAAGSAGQGVRILSVGSLSPRKRHDLLIDALAGMADLPWALDIAGADLGGGHRDALQRMIHDAALTHRISLLGALTAEELAAAYHKADLFILASAFEGFGMAFAEAVARGLPVIGTPSLAVAEATQGAALLVPPDALAATTRDLLANPGKLAERAAISWRTARNLPRWPQTAARIAHVLQETAR